MEAGVVPASRGFLQRGVSALRRAARKRWKQWADWVRMARRLSRYARKRRSHLLLSLAFGLGFTAVGLCEPWLLKLIFDNVILGHPPPTFLSRALGELAGDRLQLLNVLVAAIVLTAVARGILYYYQKLLAARAGQEVSAALRLDLYSHIQHLSLAFHDRRRSGDLVSRLTSDIRLLRDIFIALPLSLTSEVFLVAGMVVIMAVMDWSLTLMALSVLPGIAVILRFYQRPMKQAMRRQRDREGEIASMAAEALGAIRVVQGFQREEYEVERLGGEQRRSLRTGLRAARLEAKLRWYAEVAVAVVTAVVVGVAARRVLARALSPGDLIVFMAYLRSFNRPLRRVSSMAERAARGTAAGERILETLELEPEVQDLPGAVRAPRFRGEIVFDGVSLAHRRSAPVLSDIHLQVQAGERVAIVGPTGSGKTSLVSLIPRFYDPTRGRVWIDGMDLKGLTLASLRDRISLVFQEPILFATTIAENIAYGKPGATPDEIKAAAQRAGIHSVIAALPEGYETTVGERGATLSGGERQCVAIARAMIKDAPIVILDEPTTGLDNYASSLVVAALQQLMEKRTVIIISHQLATIQGVDRIVVLEKGCIVEEGTHAGLLERGGLYHSLRQLQDGGVKP